MAVTDFDAFTAGPGGPPEPWRVSGASISYDGSILVPAVVTGGVMGPGTINASGLFINGVSVQSLISGYLPLVGGTLTGALHLNSQIFISGTANLKLADSVTNGQVLSADGVGGTFWATLGGPYLPLTGGTITGVVTIPLADLHLSGGLTGQVLSTNGSGILGWINGGGGNLPAGGAISGYILASDGATTPYWTNVLPGGPYAVAVSGGYIPLFGGTMTGLLTLFGDPTTTLQAATKQYVDNSSSVRLPLSGGTLTGPLILAANPTVALGTATKQYVDNNSKNDNRILNSSMRVDQHNNGASGTALLVYTADRWQYGGSQAGKITWQRVNSTCPGFPYALSATVNVAYTSLSTDFFYFIQPIEADFVGDFQWGTANAQPVSLSFWVICTLSGNFGGSFIGAATRSYPFIFNIPTPNTWTKITIPNIPGDTTGSWIMRGNSTGVSLCVDLGSGSNYLGTAGTWASANLISATGSVKLVGTLSANFQFSGVKLELGSYVTPYITQSPSQCLDDCQRYYQKIGGVNAFDILIQGYSGISGGLLSACIGIHPMRIPPIITTAGTFAASNVSSVNFYAGLQTLSIQIISTAIGPVGWTNDTTAKYLTLNSEL